jgi:SAM-dependent methyltransferase
MSTPLKTAPLYERVTHQRLASHAEQWGSLVTCAQYRQLYRKTADYVPEGSLCLDWGCGSGHFSYFLVHSGYSTRAFSFDPPPSYIVSEPRFQHSRGNMSDPFSLPYPSENFDAVFSIGVLEHVHEFGGDQARSVRELERVLKPGGHFVVFHLPNRYSWIESLVRVLNRWTGSQRHAHSKLYTRLMFEELLEGTSFEILDSGRYNIIPRNSFNRIPGALANRRWVCRMVDAFDDALAWMCPWLCQNWYFILRKKGARPEEQA